MHKTVSLTIKSADDGARTFTGIATTPAPDRMGDIVEPKGAVFSLPLPFLDQHDAERTLGEITHARITDKGIEVSGYIHKPDADAPPHIVERLAGAYYELKKGLKRKLSIGFNPIEYSRIEKGGLHFRKWEWLELSLVTIAAQDQASILTVKSPTNSRPALGLNANAGGAIAYSAGATALPPRGKGMNTISQQLAALREQRASKSARARELDELRTNENRAFTDDERIEVRSITAELADIGDDIAVKEAQQVDIGRAREVTLPGAQRGPTILIRKSDPEDKFKGQSGMRRVICKAIAAIEAKEGNYVSPAQIAEERYGKTHPMLVATMKTAVPGGGSGTGEWGSELVAADTRYTGDFVEYLYGETVFDKLPLREVPHNVSIKAQDGASTGYWVGESKAIPNTNASFASTPTSPLKVAAICVMSKELVRDSSPSAEMIMRDSIREAITQRIDQTFLSALAAVPTVSPAGILNGLVAGSSSGNTADDIRADIMSLLSGFITAKNVRGLYLVTTPSLAASLGMMRNALGQVEFPGLTSDGGTLNGYNVVVGDNVGVGDVIMLKPSDIWKIGDLGVTFSASTEAMIEQDTAPTGATDTPTAASLNFTSMYQEESVALKVVRPINFGIRRAGAVAYIGNAAWGAAGSP